MVARKRTTGGHLTAKRSTNADINDTEGVREVLNRLESDSGSPQQIVQYWADFCRDALMASIPGVDVRPKRVEESVLNASFKHPDWPWYCAKIINHADIIESLARNGDLWTAVGFGFRFGKLVKELQVLDYEPPLRSGLALSEGGKKGTRVRDAQKDDRNRQIKADFDAAVASGLLKKQASSKVAERFGISARQVQRIVKKETT